MLPIFFLSSVHPLITSVFMIKVLLLPYSLFSYYINFWISSIYLNFLSFVYKTCTKSNPWTIFYFILRRNKTYTFKASNLKKIKLCKYYSNTCNKTVLSVYRVYSKDFLVELKSFLYLLLFFILYTSNGQIFIIH